MSFEKTPRGTYGPNMPSFVAPVANLVPRGA